MQHGRRGGGGSVALRSQGKRAISVSESSFITVRVWLVPAHEAGLKDYMSHLPNSQLTTCSFSTLLFSHNVLNTVYFIHSVKRKYCNRRRVYVEFSMERSVLVFQNPKNWFRRKRLSVCRCVDPRRTQNLLDRFHSNFHKTCILA